MAESATNARNQAQEATSKATDTVRAQVDQRSSDVGEKVASTATDIRSVGDHLRQQGKEQPAKVADRAAKQVERAGTWLRESDSDRILHDIEDFGRRQPWAFAVGGLAMGMVAARLLKASSSKRYQQHRQLAPASNGIGSAGGHPPGLGDTPTYRREAERLDVTRKTPPATSAAPAPPSSGANEVA